MGSEWRDTVWGELATLEYGRGIRDYQESSGRFRVFGTNGPIGWTDHPLCTHPGVVIGRKGAYRGVHYSPEPFFAIDTAFYLEPKTDIDMRWAYYQLLTQDINGMDSGSAIPSTSRDAFYRLPVSVPPIEEQRRITGFLGALDDKIELNRRMSQTLESMARALFKSWFVDFDPVRAKANGRDPGLGPQLAGLFPDAFVSSVLGDVPTGWRASRLSELVTLNPSRALERANPSPYLDMANMPTSGHSALDITVRPYSSGSRFVNGDTLMARITPCLENGKTAFVDFLPNGAVGWGSTEFLVLRPKAPLPPEFGYCLARSERFREFAIQGMSGSSGRQRVSVEAVGTYPVVEPPMEVAAAFGSTASALLARASSARREDHFLARQRDSLLVRFLGAKEGTDS